MKNPERRGIQMESREKYKKEPIKLEKEIKRAQKIFGDIFDNHKDGQKRVEDIVFAVEPFLKSNLIDDTKVRHSLEECATITEKEEFVRKVLFSLEPIIELRVNNPKAFEEIQRKTFIENIEKKIEKKIEKGDFKKLNEILSYNQSKDSIHIHLAPSKEIRIHIRDLAREGLEELAKIVQEKKEIKEIRATSFIVAAIPKTMEKLGFTIEREVDKEIREKYFGHEQRKVCTAKMTREKFLDKYLKREKI